MNWLSEMFEGKKINKEAEQTDAATEFAKKLKASSWAEGVLSIDEDNLAKEQEAKIKADLAIRDEFITKEAAYEAFQTTEETLKQDYARDCRILSDYALTEMIAEIRGHNNQDFMENASEYKEKAQRDVKSDRKAVERELLENVGMSAQVNWAKAFEKYKKDETPKQATEKELYKAKLEDVNDDLSKGAKVDEYALTDEQHAKTMQGVGREEKERTDVTQEAGETKNEALGKTSEKKAALVRDPDTELRVGTIVRLARTVMTKEGFLIPAGSAWEITGCDGFHYTISANGQSHTISSHDTPKFDTIKKSASQEIENHATHGQILVKIAEITSPWQVVKDEKGNEVIARVDSNSNTKESEENKDLNK